MNPSELPMQEEPVEAGTETAPATIEPVEAAEARQTQPEQEQDEQQPGGDAAPEADPVEDAAQFLEASSEEQPSAESMAEADLRAVVEAVIYVTEEPLTLEQIAAALEQPKERIAAALEQLIAGHARPERGISIREVAGGYKMGTKPEHHDAVRAFVKRLKPPLKLSMAALETLAVIAYKQPITSPEIMEIRGVQGASVLKTLLDRKLIVPAGRKQVVGKPVLYKTTKDFLLQFGLKDLAELPTLKEFEELRRLAFSDVEEAPQEPSAAAAASPAAGEAPPAEPPVEASPTEAE
ncbi:MAG: SMC-Scp complex subunit ScpB [Bryobacterales bacterium]|nr:SMC-Scp complex subunit ScpB [Bryobacterales bacterium]